MTHDRITSVPTEFAHHLQQQPPANPILLCLQCDTTREELLHDIAELLLRQLVSFVQSLRDENIRKSPSIAESVDWARTLLLLHAPVLDETLVRDTLNVLLKRESDIQEMQGRLAALTQAAVDQSVGSI